MVCIIMRGTRYSRWTFELLPSQQSQLAIGFYIFPSWHVARSPAAPTLSLTCSEPGNSTAQDHCGTHISIFCDTEKYRSRSHKDQFEPWVICFNLSSKCFLGFHYKGTRLFWNSYTFLPALNLAEWFPLATGFILITWFEKVFPPTIFQNSHFLSISECPFGLVLWDITKLSCHTSSS